MSDNKHISLLVTSDVHGYINPTNYSDHVDRNLGLAKLSTLIKRKRKKENVLLLDNGDLIQGSPLTFYHAKYQSKTPNPMVKVANHLGYVASVLGNHEFNYGQEYLKEVINQSEFPWLSATTVNESDEEPAFGKPYIIHNINEISVAILGITTHYIPNWEDPKHIENLSFNDAFETTKKWVNQIHEIEKPDLLIVSYHGGFERDIHSGEPTEELTGENQGYQMCMEIDGIDVLVTGHQHRSIADKLNGVTIIQPSNNGQLLGQVDIELEKRDKTWAVKEAVPSLIEIDDRVEADKEVVDLIKDYEDATQAWLDKPIGKINGDMTITDSFSIRLQDNPLIEFINKVQMNIANVDISNTSLFNNASPGFKSNVTMRDIVSNYIYPNTLKVIRISGMDIKLALEQSATYFIINVDGEIDVNPAFVEPKPQHYNYDMWEGIEYELNISNPIGERVTHFNYQGKPIDYNQHYDVVMNNYRAGGGGNFRMYQEKPVVKDIPTDMTELIANYILQRETIEATCDYNWKVIK
ncbi:bifunctional metallophosphatase/5'-nucleotidase [Aquibacillus halophilus]|uniref:Bifunctional metallophosphatase/5'-nucleotidase n=1 Tax=Aquibacillus halophilus TaxID=930132 RepID=A0A6A8DET3_9BACI|nr:bifunctional UDP-sugar hydrolase/5'-nucleotidase [Aquibacillus halophilus]MRH44208.1 bifunctional metallophosphatase/5'-nucleotidase [Aquibacillus halophilus]